MSRPDFSLYGVLDASIVGERDVGALAASAVAGGATVLQYRDKSGSARDMALTVERIKDAVASSDVPVIVNDRVDVAAATGAAGVHLGQDDLAPEAARRILGPDAIIGATIRTDEEALTTALEAVDYVGLGGVFASATKSNSTAPIGISGVGRITRRLRERKPGIVVVAIAGIDADGAAPVIAAGADGIAVVSALFADRDVTAAARRLVGAIRAGQRGRADQ